MHVYDSRAQTDLFFLVCDILRLIDSYNVRPGAEWTPSCFATCFLYWYSLLMKLSCARPVIATVGRCGLLFENDISKA